MASDPKYWLSMADRAGDPVLAAEATREFPEELPVGPGADPGPDPKSRRDFLKIMGLSASALAAASACSRAPVRQIVPYGEAPEDSVPGVALEYASVCGACAAGCGTVVRTRDGRPIKLEGNPQHPVSAGALCALGQAAVLGPYDASRAPGPHLGGAPASWESLDDVVRSGLGKVAASGQGIRVVAPADLGPTGEAALAAFAAKFPTTKRVLSDPLGLEAIAAAHQLSHGVRALPELYFDRARVVASFGADFLGSWQAPPVHTRRWSRAHDAARPEAMARLFVLEPTLTLTGAAADVRWNLAPSDQLPALAALAKALGVTLPREVRAPELATERLSRLARELGAAGSSALVVCGSDDVGVQVLVAAINDRLGAYGSTLSLVGQPVHAEAAPMASLLAELDAGSVGAVVLLGCNPVYDHPQGAALAERLDKVAVAVSTADRLDESARHCGHLAPDLHFLESWGDRRVGRNTLGLMQPTVSPLAGGRAAGESLLRWAGVDTAYRDFLYERWRGEQAAGLTGLVLQAAWDSALEAGFSQSLAPEAPEPAFHPEALAGLGDAPAPGELELVLYATVGLRDGAMANNAWLQELPDPISKTTWDGTCSLSPATAKQLGVADGDLLAIEAGGQRVVAPAVVQPGVHPRVVAVALGYGRSAAGSVGNGIGQSAWPLAGVGVAGAGVALTRSDVKLTRTGERRALAQTQTHHVMEGRPLVLEREAADYARAPGTPRRHEKLTMWKEWEYPGHRWGMTIDLSACTGCASCIVSCNAENNVPVVGRAEVANRREMHWLRSDRYYTGDPAEPGVVHQPLMCQHCENAPCETVCPVLATVHSSEGLNQQVYNRCVGTRYCANNCPYKVRRFNWFDYAHDPHLRLALNPDVVVRSRGVMEKCSLCVQRIQGKKAAARAEGLTVADGDIQTACQQSCPAQAIVFGDLNDPKSRVSRLTRGDRGYRLLEELNVGPVVSYLVRLKNTGGTP